MLLLLVFAYFFKSFSTVQLAWVPTNSITETQLSSRVIPIGTNECHSRSVYDILWSCFATTFACTWVSIHPNVPRADEGKWTILMRRIFLMIFSILAPEVMVMWAFKQWRGAVKIKTIINSSATHGLGL